VTTVIYEGVEEPYSDLERGRLSAVLLDNIIADRYGLSRPTLRTAATIGEGAYAIAVRPDASDLLAALNSALGDMIRTGELRAILTRWRLWDARQNALDTAASVSGTIEPATRPDGMTWGQIMLFMRATGVTIIISTLSMVLAVAGGLVLSIARRYGDRGTRLAATTYIEIFRGTPVLLQLYVLYYGLAPLLTLDAFTAAIAGLGMNHAATMRLIVPMEAVPAGQTDAALALGMSRGLALRRIVLPQALRVALPGVANDFIALLKDSSLVSVITVVELTKQMTITAVDVRSWLMPGLLCAALYLALSYPLSRLAADSSAGSHPPPDEQRRHRDCNVACVPRWAAARRSRDDLLVRRGEVVVIVGPRAAARRPLRALNYLTPFSAGTVEIATSSSTRNGAYSAVALRRVRTRVGRVPELTCPT
jgi:polar amino acid transport system substrate-binding protein